MKATDLAKQVKELGNVTTNEEALDFVRGLTTEKQRSPAIGVTIVIDADSGVPLAYGAHPFGLSTPVTMMELAMLKAACENFVSAQVDLAIEQMKEQAIREAVTKELAEKGEKKEK